MPERKLPCDLNVENENVMDPQGEGNAPSTSISSASENACFQGKILNIEHNADSEEDKGNGNFENEPSISTLPQISHIECIPDSMNALSDSSLPFMELPNSELEEASVIRDMDDLGDTSAGSIPLLEQTPSIIDNGTPNLSLDTTADESENLQNSGTEGRKSIQGLLFEAGYTLLEIENMSSISKQKCQEGSYGRSRPQTQVFYQGKTFTYEKLEVDCFGGKSEAIVRKDHTISNMSIPTSQQNEFDYSVANLNPGGSTFHFK